MKSFNVFLAATISLALGFSSCQPEDKNTYNIPSTYNFDNVNYEGQTVRLSKMAELITYLKTANAVGATALDAAKIKDMYGDNAGNHYSTADLNTASQQLKNKTLSTEQANIESYIDAIATASLSTSTTASNGQAGVISNNAGTKHYLLNENGLELREVIEKGLMGALSYYQATSVYLGAGKIDVDNTTSTPGKGTAMEHHWDEAFGYFGVAHDFPTNTTNSLFWGKYSNVHENVYPLNKKMMDAFLKGRAAISAKDINTRDEMIAEVRKNWELIAVATAIYYLNKAKNNLGSDDGATHHTLSEGFGLIRSLKLGTGSGNISIAQVDDILANLYGSADALQANAYTVDAAKIEAAKTALVSYFSDLASVKDTL